MGLLINLILAVVHFVFVAIDVIGLFLVLRILAIRWPKALLRALDAMGRPVIDPMVRAVSGAMPAALNRCGLRVRMIPPFVLLFMVEVGRLALWSLGLRMR